MREAVDKQIPVVSLPGANAALTGLVASGLPTDRFVFYGFVPREKKQLSALLEEIQKRTETMIFYESPYRIRQTLQAMLDALGERKIVLARELTKAYEEYTRGNLSDVVEFLNRHEQIRGEFTLILEGGTDREEEAETAWWKGLSAVEHVEVYVKQGLSAKDAVKQVARDRKRPKREIYQAYHR